jgi:DNA-binding HxlR family transcriptional regulator
MSSRLLSSPEVDPGADAARAAARLAALAHHRWALPVLAELSSGAAGGRAAPLLARLGVARPSLRRTLDGLVAGGLVRRNPGYGHPLRPELLLTDRGRALGPWCTRMRAAAERAGVADAVLRKWSLAVLVALGAGCARFSEVRGLCAGVTPRALTLALARLEAEGLVTRTVYDDRPPSVRYGLTRSGKALAALAARVP